MHTDNQLEMTTKRTIMENEQMSTELSYQSRQTEKLLSKNKVSTGQSRGRGTHEAAQEHRGEGGEGQHRGRVGVG